jgi:hypothetical protein
MIRAGGWEENPQNGQSRNYSQTQNDIETLALTQTGVQNANAYSNTSYSYLDQETSQRQMAMQDTASGTSLAYSWSRQQGLQQGLGSGMEQAATYSYQDTSGGRRR